MRAAIGRVLDKKSITRGCIDATDELGGLAPTLMGGRLLKNMLVGKGVGLGRVLSDSPERISDKC